MIEPIIATIQQRYITGELMPYFDAQPIASNDFYQALVEAGVNNVDAYECILQSEDGKVQYRGFKAINIIGVITASQIDTKFCTDALIFRLQENASVIVHEKVKKHLESKNFPSMVFRDPGASLVL